MTTQAVGEEGGRVTTYAVGEEGGYPRPRPGATTYAVGEEGGYRPPSRYRPPYYGYRRPWWWSYSR
jgi:hypothetical protein